jgi:hypothetical protein
VIRVFVRRDPDISYLRHDRALEIGPARDGPATWWPLGQGDDARDVLGDRRGGVIGYDLVVAAPRPASSLLAVGTPDEQRAVVAAHRRAVRDAIGYLDERAVVVRRQVLGDVDEVPARWRHAAGFTHGVNRSGEPHLHDHVLVASRVGASRALDSSALFTHLGAADALYRASLRHGITTTTDRAAWRSLRGGEHVAGVDEGVRSLWPGRANDRGDKLEWSRDDAVAAWTRDFARYEPGPSVPVPTRARDRVDEHAFAAAFEGASRIRRPDLVTAWADAATFGASRASVESSLAHWYPELDRERGRGSVDVTRTRARMLGHVREFGPRSLELDIPQRDRSRDSRELSRERSR